MAITGKKKKLMVTAIAGAMAATIAVGGGTFAYFQSQTQDVKNEFKTEQVNVEISETPREYDIIPGTEQDKDPKLTITNTVDSFLFVKVTDKTYGLVTYTIADGWTKLDGYDDVYYRKVTADFDDEGNVKSQEFDILKDNKVSYDKSLVNEDMLDGEGNLRTDVALSFEGFAIQARPFTDPTDSADPTSAPTEKQAAANAYEQQPIKVSSINDIKNAISAAPNGATVNIVLTDDITTTEQIDVRNKNLDLIIDGNGHTMTADVDANTSFIYADKGIKIINTTLDVNDTAHALYSTAGTVELTDVTVNLHGENNYDTPWPILLYGGGPSTLTNCTVNGNYKPVSEGGRYSWANVWAGDGRTLTINGGSYGSIFVNASNGAGILSAGTIIVNDGTIGKLMLETEKNKYQEGEYAPKTAYKSAILIHNGGTITNLVENPQNYDLSELTKLN